MIILTIEHNFHAGLLSENCFVLAEGSYEDKMFEINAFGFAPPETSMESRFINQY